MKPNQKGLETVGRPRGARRYFAIEVRKAIVQEIDEGLSKSEASRKYDVSLTSLYKWLAVYSTKYKKELVTVVEHTSNTNKVSKLEAELQEAYALLGRTQAEVMYLQKLIDTASDDLGLDLKKNSGIKPSSISEPVKIIK